MDFPRGLFLALAAGLLAPLIAIADTGDSSPSSKPANPSIVTIEMEDRPTDRAPRAKPYFENNSMAADRRTMEAIQAKLQQTILAEVVFRDVTVTDALGFLTRETGVPMVVLHQIDAPLPAHAVEASEARLTLSLKNVSAGEALRYVAQLTMSVPRIEPGAVIMRPEMFAIQALESEDFHIPRAIAGTVSKEFLQSKGVAFPRGSTIDYNRSKDCLTVRNIEDSLMRIEIILDALLSQPELKKKIGDETELTRELEWRQTLEWKQTFEKRRVREVKVHDASMEEIVRELRSKGVIFWIETQVDPYLRISFSMKDTSVSELLQRIAELTKTQAVIGFGSIAFVPAAVK